MINSEQLLQQIDDIVASKTFGLDALEGIKKIKDSLKATLDERDALQKRYDGLYETNGRQSDEIQRLTARVAEQTKELQGARELAAKGQEAIFHAEKHKAVADAWQGAMSMVFKPNAVRETIARNVVKPVAGSPGGNGSYPTPGFLVDGKEYETITREDA